MRILHIVYSCVPGQFRGGVAKVVYDLARAQVRLGHQVTVYTTNYNSSIPADVPIGQFIESEGVRIHYFRVDNVRWFRSKSLRTTLLSTAPGYDVIHSHNTFLALNRYAAEAHQQSGKPLFYHVHGALDPIVVKKGFSKSLRKRLYILLIESRNLRNANGLFAFSPNEVEQIRTYGIRVPTFVVPNGVWATNSRIELGGERFRERLNLKADQEIILFMGRIVPKKGVHVLVRAFAEIHKQFPQTVLVIAGDRKIAPNYVRYLDKLIVDAGITESVCWTGFLNESEKHMALAAATVFSHVSQSEGMAMSILEAMATGLPTIVSKECYMSRAANAQALVEVEYNVENLCVALTNLLSNLEQRYRIGQIARDYVCKHHTWQQIAQEVVQAYESALEHAR